MHKELITLAKLYIEKNRYQKADETYEKAINEFFDFENGLSYANFLYKQNQLKQSTKIYNKLLKADLTTYQKATTLNNRDLINR